MQRECEAQVLRIAVQVASYARFVAHRTRDLSVDQASYVDERGAESADGRIPWSRFEDLVTGLVVASDPEAAAQWEDEVALMTPADTFPWGVSTSCTQQVDHTEAFRHRGPPGRSRVGNYGPMTTFHRRIKAHAGWQVRQPFPGICLWRDPHGATYLVDHSGTRRLDRRQGMSPAEAHVTRALFQLTA